MIVKLSFNDGFKQNKLNCLAIKGFMSSFTIGWGLPPAHIEHDSCAVDGSENCIYRIEWQPKKKNFKSLRYLILSVIIIIEIFLISRNILDFKDLIITVFIFFILFILLKYLTFFDKKTKEEVFNYKKNMSIIDAMEKIEKDNFEINLIKQELENRNIYLSIVNELNDKIAYSKNFNGLLMDVAKILVNRLRFFKGVYFQIDKEGLFYTPLFEIKTKIVGHRHDSLDEYKISKSEYAKIINYHNFICIKDCRDEEVILSQNILDWFSANKENILYFLPVNTNDNFSGFYCLVAENKEIIPQKLIIDLLNNISSQLQIGYQKITSALIIENILSSIPSFVILFDNEKNEIKYVNNMFLNSFPHGHDDSNFDEVIGKNLFKIIPFDEEAKNIILNFLKNKSIDKKSENHQTTFDKKVFEYSIFSINDSNKNTLYSGIVLTDVTESVNFEQQLLLNEKLLALGKVASGISHEINNPLYVVLANAEEIASSKEVNPTIKQYAEEIVEYSVHISDIIKDLSSYSKSLRNEAVVEIDINNIIEESLKLVKYSLNFTNMEIIKNFGEIPKISATKGEMEQVFINLLKNAMHAMNGIGVLEINTNFSKNNIFISIKDSGCGINKENLPNIFDLFFTTKREGEGTGQGLHIVKKILSKYNAEIRVESEINKGTTFFIEFKVGLK